MFVWLGWPTGPAEPHKHFEEMASGLTLSGHWLTLSADWADGHWLTLIKMEYLLAHTSTDKVQ